MCGQYNVRATAVDNIGQNTKDTHPVPEQKLKFLNPWGIEPGPTGWKAGLLPTTQEPRLQFCPRQVFHCKLRNQGCSSAQGKSFTANAGTKVAVMPKAGLSLQTQEPRLQFCPRQVLHCKRRNLGCCSAEGRSSTANSGTNAAVLRGIEQVRQLPVAFCTPLSLQHLNRP